MFGLQSDDSVEDAKQAGEPTLGFDKISSTTALKHLNA